MHKTCKAKASLQIGALAVDLTMTCNCWLSLCRLILEPAVEGRLRLDAGTWGTMGVGLGYAIAAATCTDRLVVAVEGDSAFGFSGMEVETIVRCVVKSVSITNKQREAWDLHLTKTLCEASVHTWVP